MNLMRLRVFDALPADVGDKIKERLDSVFLHASQKWDSVEVDEIAEFKNTFSMNIQKLLKEFLIKAYSTVVAEEERRNWSSALAAFFKSQLELKLIIETGGSISHVAAETDKWAQNLKVALDLFGNSSIGLTEEYKNLFDVG